MVREHGITRHYCRGHACDAIRRGATATGVLAILGSQCSTVPKRIAERFVVDMVADRLDPFETPLGLPGLEPITITIEFNGRAIGTVSAECSPHLRRSL